MPLRDHFHSPLLDQRHWEGFHSAWGNTIVRHLSVRLPRRYYAEPHIHFGVEVEADVVAFEEEATVGSEGGAGNGVATAVWAPAKPAQSVTIAFPEQDLFEVRVYDEQRTSRLVAVVELVSPANKDRPANRGAFAVKCASHLQQRVSVVVVDVVTAPLDDLSAEVLGLLGLEDLPGWPADPPLSAVAWRTTKEEGKWRLDTWAEPLRLGAALPTLPLWLAANLAVPLELEASYEETCQVLRIR